MNITVKRKPVIIVVTLILLVVIGFIVGARYKQSHSALTAADGRFVSLISMGNQSCSLVMKEGTGAVKNLEVKGKIYDMAGKELATLAEKGVKNAEKAEGYILYDGKFNSAVLAVTVEMEDGTRYMDILQTAGATAKEVQTAVPELKVEMEQV